MSWAHAAVVRRSGFRSRFGRTISGPLLPRPDVLRDRSSPQRSLAGAALGAIIVSFIDLVGYTQKVGELSRRMRKVLERSLARRCHRRDESGTIDREAEGCCTQRSTI